MTNKFTIEIIEKEIIKLFIPSDKIVQIEKIIYALKYNFNLIFWG